MLRSTTTLSEFHIKSISILRVSRPSRPAGLFYYFLFLFRIFYICVCIVILHPYVWKAKKKITTFSGESADGALRPVDNHDHFFSLPLVATVWSEFSLNRTVESYQRHIFFIRDIDLCRLRLILHSSTCARGEDSGLIHSRNLRHVGRSDRYTVSRVDDHRV